MLFVFCMEKEQEEDNCRRMEIALLVWTTLFVSGVSGRMAVLVWRMFFYYCVSGRIGVVISSM